MTSQVGRFFYELMERIERLQEVYIPERGVRVELPPQCSVFSNPKSGDVLISHSEIERIKAIMKDPTLKKRYPKPEDGQAFMMETSPEWRSYLLSRSKEAAAEIGWNCERMGYERFAVVLFGSVSRNLVKHPKHPDPSNIDLAVIGEFSPYSREPIFDRIRPLREHLTSEINQNEGRYNEDGNFERLTVLVQPIDNVRSMDYFSVRTHISACARPLYDPTSLWNELEKEAMPYVAFYNLTKGERRMLHRRGLTPQPAIV